MLMKYLLMFVIFFLPNSNEHEHKEKNEYRNGCSLILRVENAQGKNDLDLIHLFYIYKC